MDDNNRIAHSDPRPVAEPWPGYTADQDRRRVVTLATLGLMLSVMAGGDAAKVVGFDASDLYAEVLMALAIEDSEFPDIALGDACDNPDDYALATHSPAPMAGWRDIASAPKDGRDALVGCWVYDENGTDAPIWSAWETISDGGPLGCDGTWGDPPTHWHDMPAPPAAAHPSTQEGADRG